MEVTTNVSIDMIRRDYFRQIVVNVKQRDKYARKIQVILYASGAPWPIPAGVAAAIRYSKPDGTKGLYDQLPDGTQAWSVSENVITITLAPQVLTAAGTVRLDVLLTLGAAELATFDMLVNVLPAPVSDGDLESQDYYNYSTLAEINNAIGDLAALKTMAKGSLVEAINEAVDSDRNSVLYEPQALTEAERKQARDNIGAQAQGNYALVSQLPTVPVQSVNGKTGAVQLDAASVGADPTGSAFGQVAGHNTSDTAHADIRLLITELAKRFNALADSEDIDLDQLSELVAYIKANRSLIDSITTSKVSVVDIVNNLVTNVADKPLSAAQGVALKLLVDTLDKNKITLADLAAKFPFPADGDDGKFMRVVDGAAAWVTVPEAEGASF